MTDLQWGDVILVIVVAMSIGGCIVVDVHGRRRIEAEAIRAGLVQDSAGHWFKQEEEGDE